MRRRGLVLAVSVAALFSACGPSGARAEGVPKACHDAIADAATPLGQVYTVISLCQGRTKAAALRETFFTAIDRKGLSPEQYRDVLAAYYIALGSTFEAHASCDDSALDVAETALERHFQRIDVMNAACASPVVPPH